MKMHLRPKTQELRPGFGNRQLANKNAPLDTEGQNSLKGKIWPIRLASDFPWPHQLVAWVFRSLSTSLGCGKPLLKLQAT